MGAVAFAVLADLARPSVRAQAYSITGIAIGAWFMIGLLAGPLLAAQIGLNDYSLLWRGWDFSP